MGEGTLEFPLRKFRRPFSQGEKGRMRGGSAVHRGTKHRATLMLDAYALQPLNYIGVIPEMPEHHPG